MKHNYKDFSFTNENYLILRSIEHYTRTDSGKSWKSKPDEVENKIVTPEHYTNYITSIPFFNNWGDGASCRAAYTYNAPGYLPTTITTISPFKTEKQIATFVFIKKSDLLKNAGYRETEIVKNAKSFSREWVTGRGYIYTFYTNDNGVTNSGLYEENTKLWRG